MGDPIRAATTRCGHYIPDLGAPARRAGDQETRRCIAAREVRFETCLETKTEDHANR
jgi:hypothetical protein